MKHPISFATLIAAVTLFSYLPLVAASAQDRAGSNGTTLSGTDNPPNRIDLEFGYFTCRRQMFREIYGSYFDYGLNFQHRINNRWSWSLRSEFIRLHEEESVVKYWSLSETPLVIYAFRDRAPLIPVIGGGVGLTYRKVIAELERYTATQRELSAMLVAMTGVDLHVSDALVLGGRLYFDYHPLGDPSKGDFGDTGGYHFTFRLGFKF